MSRGAPISILLVLAVVSGAGGYSFLDLGIGGPVYTGSARGSAMGEVGWLSEENAFSTMINPATLGMIDRPDAALAYQYCYLDETRAFPAYDSFDAILGYNVYATNKNYYQNVAVGFATGVLPQALGLSFGVAYSPVYDLNYDYEEEIRDRSTSSQPADEVIADAFIKSDGTLNALSFGAGRMLWDGASLGVGLDYVFGEYDALARVVWRDGTPETIDKYSASKQSGVRMRIAGRVQMGERIEFGFQGTSKCKMKGDFSADTGSGLLWFLPVPDTGDNTLTWSDAETVYPVSFGVGIRIRPRNDLIGLFEIGMKYTAWSDYKSDFYGDFELEDVYTWHAGVEHVFYNGLPARFGLLYSPSPKEKGVSEAAFTFGTGYKAYGWNVDFSGNLGWNKYRYPDVFDDEMFGLTRREPGQDWRDEVRDMSFSGVLSFTRRF
jgi:long-subunit fatty acid transport protein